MSRFRKKPVEIEARQWPGGEDAAKPIIDWVLAEGGTARWDEGEEVGHTEDAPRHMVGEHLSIDTLEGVHRASPGDWIIQGVEGEFYPCKPTVFEHTYEPVEVTS